MNSRSPIEQNSPLRAHGWKPLMFKAALPFTHLCVKFFAFKERGRSRDKTSLCWSALSAPTAFSLEIHLLGIGEGERKVGGVGLSLTVIHVYKSWHQ